MSVNSRPLLNRSWVFLPVDGLEYGAKLKSCSEVASPLIQTVDQMLQQLPTSIRADENNLASGEKKLNKDRKSSFLFFLIWFQLKLSMTCQTQFVVRESFFSSESQQLKRKFASEEFSVFDQKEIFRQFFAWNYLLHEPEYFSKLWKHLLNFFMFRGL